MTAQEPEILIVDGQKYEMPCCPPISRDGNYQPGFFTRTSNYRGYVGTWEIKDDKLYLVGGPHGMEYPVFADWVNQEIHIWNGPELEYVHAGFGSVYEEDVYFSVEKGVITGGRKESNVDKFCEFAKEQVNRASTQARISCLYSQYLAPESKLTQLADIEGPHQSKYTLLQLELEELFKERLHELSKNPNSGIKLVYK